MIANDAAVRTGSSKPHVAHLATDLRDVDHRPHREEDGRHWPDRA
jgi:hypothetical protein